MPDPEKILATVRRATTLFRATPGRSGGLITLDSVAASEVLVVGDLHGNIPGFRQALEVSALGKNPARHLILQELVHGIRMYPDDKGDRSHQLVDLVCALKCQYPERVHLILGNHELSELTGRVIGKNGVALNALFRQGIETAYGKRADAIYAAYLELFAALPLAVRTPNRVFVCHTIPDGYELDGLDLEVFGLETWPPEAMKRHGSGLLPDLGSRHRARDGRSIRRDGRCGLVHHGPPAVRHRFPSGEPPADHHRWHRPEPGVLPLFDLGTSHDRDAPGRGSTAASSCLN